MANVINYATKYADGFDQVIRQEALSVELETPNVNWLNANSFQVSTIETSGFRPHTRTKGYNEGSVSNTREVYTLDFDRDVEFFVDKMDVDESRQDVAAGNITNEFLRTHAIPEIDAYRFSKLAKTADTAGNAVTEAITKENVFDKLKDALLPIRKYGPGNTVMYVSSQVMDALERSTSFNRSVVVQNIAAGSKLETRIASIDGVRLVEVWDENRFADKFDFSDGFKATEDAKKINFLAVAKHSVLAKQKVNSVYLFQPGQHTQGDGYLYQNRMYHDLFVLKNQVDGVRVSLATE